jgi:hypothetical protein
MAPNYQANSKNNAMETQPEGGKTNEHQQLNEWTIIIYHSGETSLSEELVWSLKEMVRVGKPNRVAVVALMDTLSPDLYKFTLGRRRTGGGGEIEENGLFHNKNVFVVKNPRFPDPHEKGRDEKDEEQRVEAHLKSIFHRANLASSKMLRNFVVQTIKDHPAKRFMLILSGHGHGMVGKTFLLDEGAKRFMSIPRLNWALGEIMQEIGELLKLKGPRIREQDPRIDILGFDSCGMLTAEVANLLKDEVKFIVGSEGVMHRAGWPYHLILDFLKTRPTASAADLAEEIVFRCVNYYADFSRVGVSIDMAAIELKRVVEGGKARFPFWDALMEAIRALAVKISKYAIEAQHFDSEGDADDSYPEFRRALGAVITAHWYAQSYATEEYVDLQDFCEQLKISSPDLRDECKAIIDALERVRIKSCYAGGEFQHSHGLSLYFPWSANDADLFRYSMFRPKGERKFIRTPFNEATLWGEFLWEFSYATRRRPRKDQGELIFMPPPGYRDHLEDYAAESESTSKQRFELDFIISPDETVRDNPPHPRDNPPHPRGNDFNLCAKVKNPSMVFHDNKCAAPNPKAKPKSGKR